MIDVIECDTDEGWLVTYERDAFGDFILNDDEISRVKLFGTVTVEDRHQ